MGIGSSNNTIDCGGGVLKATGPGAVAVYLNNNVNETIINCRIENADTGIRLYQAGTYWTRIDNVTFINDSTNAIWLYGANNNTISNIRIINASSEGIYLSNNPAQYNLITNLSVEGQDGSNYGIRFASPVGHSFNRFVGINVNITGANNNGIDMNGSTYYNNTFDCQGGIIRGNNGSSSYGISIEFKHIC
jgi:hypothetical protein